MSASVAMRAIRHVNRMLFMLSVIGCIHNCIPVMLNEWCWAVRVYFLKWRRNWRRHMRRRPLCVCSLERTWVRALLRAMLAMMVPSICSNAPVASLRATGPGCDCFSIPILSFIKPKSLVWAAFVYCKITLVSHSWLGFFLQSVVDYVTFCHVRVVEKCLKNMLMYWKINIWLSCLSSFLSRACPGLVRGGRAVGTVAMPCGMAQPRCCTEKNLVVATRFYSFINSWMS